MKEVQRRVSAMAVASMILGIVTMPGVFCCVGYGTGVLALVLGGMALIAVHNGDVSKSSAVMAWAGVITATLAMLGYAVYFALVLTTVVG
mgnify:CR=1 FL=1